MRRLTAILLAVMMMTVLCTAATAEDTFTMAGFDGDNVGHDWKTNKFFERMREKTGIAFEFQQYTDYDVYAKAKDMLLSEGNMPDVLFKAELDAHETLKYYNEGKIIDLKPYIQEYAPNLYALLSANPEWEKAITLPDGAIAALPNLNQLQNNNAMWINTAWLKNLKLDMPQNAEQLTEVLRAFRDGDPNRNGKADEIPLTFIGMWDLRWLAHAYGIVSNDYYLTADENGNVSEVITTDEFRAFLEWLHLLWDERLIDHAGFSGNSSMRQITDTNQPMTYGVMLATTPLLVVPSASLDQYSMLEPLEYNGRRVYRDLLGEVVRGTFAVTSACKDPAKLVAWVDYLYTEEGSRLAQCGEEDTEYFWNENGQWEWMSDQATVANSVLPEATISEGGNAPGLTSAEFQLSYADEMTHTALEQLQTLGQYSVLPYPPVYPDEETTAKINAIQTKVADYAENTMACFVTGDIKLNDDTWNEFCEQVRANGIDELAQLFADLLK
ncbi:MAG: extracellular solute-binding protein [Clostridia bacterium]|nr:extracellular solute-binding protein [Clostridia bacterium]